MLKGMTGPRLVVHSLWECGMGGGGQGGRVLGGVRPSRAGWGRSVSSWIRQASTTTWATVGLVHSSRLTSSSRTRPVKDST